MEVADLITELNDNLKSSQTELKKTSIIFQQVLDEYPDVSERVERWMTTLQTKPQTPLKSIPKTKK